MTTRTISPHPPTTADGRVRLAGAHHCRPLLAAAAGLALVIGLLTMFASHVAAAVTATRLIPLGDTHQILDRIAGSALPASGVLALMLALSIIWPHETWRLALASRTDRRLITTAARLARSWRRHAAHLIDAQLDDRGRSWRPGLHHFAAGPHHTLTVTLVLPPVLHQTPTDHLARLLVAGPHILDVRAIQLITLSPGRHITATLHITP